MTRLAIALYFGGGVCIVQLLHTLHAHDTYGQKRVRLLENIPGFSRSTSESPTDLPPLFPPWQLPHFQIPEGKATPLLRGLGLHATNLVFCYVMSVVYGAVATGAVYLLFPMMRSLAYFSLLLSLVVFAALHLFSFQVVGSGVENTMLEGSLVFNTILLSALAGSTITHDNFISLLQFGAALIIGPLVFWLNFQHSKENIQYGNFLTVYFVLLSVAYSEFGAVFLGLIVKS